MTNRGRQRGAGRSGRVTLASMRVRLPTILSSGQDQICVLDRDLRIVEVFGSWPKESPRRPHDLIGKRKSEIFGPDVSAVHEAACRQALKGKDVAYEWTVPGMRRPVHLLTTASPLRNDDGEVAGVLLVSRDVTALKGAQTHPEHPPARLALGGLLSKREEEVARLLCRGGRTRSIAQTLDISVETVRRHIKAMFRKTGVHSQEALVKLLLSSGQR